MIEEASSPSVLARIGLALGHEVVLNIVAVTGLGRPFDRRTYGGGEFASQPCRQLIDATIVVEIHHDWAHEDTALANASHSVLTVESLERCLKRRCGIRIQLASQLSPGGRFAISTSRVQVHPADTKPD
jgi:hypothetical protein